MLTTHLTGRVPGAALAVIRPGHPPTIGCHGLADLEWQQPVGPDTVFRLASLSKPFTALAVLLLARDGLLDLHSPIHRYLPDYPTHAREVRLEHLLTHTSGIPNFVTQPWFREGGGRLHHTDDELMRRFAEQPLSFRPGTRYAYSNSGYRLLDIIVSRTTGRPFAEVLRERVLEPAGMQDTRVVNDTDLVPRRARGYAAGFVNAPYISASVTGGAGGLVATLEDMIRFDAALRDGRLIDARTMFAPVRLPCGRTEGYGYGWGLSTYRGHRFVHHAGGIDGFSCLYARTRDDAGPAVILLTNLDGFPCTRLVRRLFDRALSLSAPERHPASVARHVLEGIAGRWTDTVHDIEITATPTGLDVKLDVQRHHMVPLDETTFVDETDPDTLLTVDSDRCTLTYPLWWVTAHRVPA
jgi:CubicO group peptidase (beta-lactamase class C family)